MPRRATRPRHAPPAAARITFKVSSVNLGSGMMVMFGGGGGAGITPLLTPFSCTPVLAGSPLAFSAAFRASVPVNSDSSYVCADDQ